MVFITFFLAFQIKLCTSVTTQIEFPSKFPCTSNAESTKIVPQFPPFEIYSQTVSNAKDVNRLQNIHSFPTIIYYMYLILLLLARHLCAHFSTRQSHLTNSLHSTNRKRQFSSQKEKWENRINIKFVTISTTDSE